jgi:hypothetical protein
MSAAAIETILDMNVRAVDYEVDAVIGALLHTGGYSGHARIIVDEDRHVIVGATMIGLDCLAR